MKTTDKSIVCQGCKTRKTINFKPKEIEKKFICECGKHSLVKNKVL